jgi:hypothetical protein
MVERNSFCVAHRTRQYNKKMLPITGANGSSGAPPLGTREREVRRLYRSSALSLVECPGMLDYRHLSSGPAMNMFSSTPVERARTECALTYVM